MYIVHILVIIRCTWVHKMLVQINIEGAYVVLFLDLLGDESVF